MHGLLVWKYLTRLLAPAPRPPMLLRVFGSRLGDSEPLKPPLLPNGHLTSTLRGERAGRQTNGRLGKLLAGGVGPRKPTPRRMITPRYLPLPAATRLLS